MVARLCDAARKHDGCCTQAQAADSNFAYCDDSGRAYRRRRELACAKHNKHPQTGATRTTKSYGNDEKHAASGSAGAGATEAATQKI